MYSSNFNMQQELFLLKHTFVDSCIYPQPSSLNELLSLLPSDILGHRSQPSPIYSLGTASLCIIPSVSPEQTGSLISSHHIILQKDYALYRLSFEKKAHLPMRISFCFNPGHKQFLFAVNDIRAALEWLLSY